MLGPSLASWFGKHTTATVLFDTLGAKMATALISALVALVVVLITGSLTAARAHDDRVWARKAAAYAAMFEAMGEMSDVFRLWWRDYETAAFPDPSPQQVDERQKAYAQAKKLLFTTVKREVWILPPAVTNEIDVLDVILTQRYDSSAEWLATTSEALRLATLRLSDFARSDMHRGGLLERFDRRKPPAVIPEGAA